MSKRTSILALVLGAALPATLFAQETKIVDFDNQLLAVTNPTTYLGGRWFFSYVDTDSSGSNTNVGYYNDPTLQTATGQTNTSALWDGTSASVPAGNGTDNLYRLRFSFMAPWDPLNGATPANRNTDSNRTYLRAYFSQNRGTGGVPDLKNPVIDITKKLRFDVYSKEPIRIALLLSEGALTTTTIGAPGSSATPLELMGGQAATADALKGTGSAGGFEIPALTWTTVVVDIPNSANYTMRNFASGNAVLDPITPGYASLAGLIFSPHAGNEALPTMHDVWIDNIRQGEPSGTLQGTITPMNLTPSIATVTANVEVFDGTGTSVALYTGVALDASGNFSIPNSLADGTYTIKANIDNGTWIKRKVDSVVVTGGAASGMSFTLPNGDIVDEGIIDIADYSKLALYFDRNNTDPDWTTQDGDGISPSMCDLNRDTLVDIADYTALALAFDKFDD